MLATALDAEIETAAIDEGSAYGAALLAGVAAGFAPDPASMADAWDRPGDEFAPDPDVADGSGELLDLMLELNGELGTTFLFSTHDNTVIQRARRVVHLVDGRVASVDDS